MIVFPCQTCQTPLSADFAQAGQLVRCPTCSTTLRVPAQQPKQAVAVGAPPMPDSGFTASPPLSSGFARMPGFRGAGGKRYGFN